ncbi:Hypothetical predicted protein [Scomber scombrus]|uniref:Uncharacterized protein n=1 Tax=Scomber scombrus TaxID=13677 RepID=A0AAV1PJ03_SCOSC
MTDGDPFISLESQTHRADVVASQKTAAPSRLYMNPVRNMRHCWISFCRNSILCARIRAPDTEDNLRLSSVCWISIQRNSSAHSRCSKPRLHPTSAGCTQNRPPVPFSVGLVTQKHHGGVRQRNPPSLLLSW